MDTDVQEAPAALDEFYRNGVDALTGGPLHSPLTAQEVVKLATAEYESTSSAEQRQLQALSELKSAPTFGLDVDHLDEVAEARWGLIVPSGERQGLCQALAPLLKHRARQLDGDPRVFEVDPETTAVEFLRASGVERGLGVVEKVPYYLLIAGNPDKLPFRFQMELNTEYATGRLHFPTLDEYAAYAEHVVEYEQADRIVTRKQVAFWAPDRQVDPATSKSAELLVRPLRDRLAPGLGYATRLWRGDGEADGVRPASKLELQNILSDGCPPALLFTASHGLGFSQPDPRQEALQGALLTQEYVWCKQVDPAQWFSASDVAQTNPDLRGLVHFAFACFGAGTPTYNDYTRPNTPATVIADRGFVAGLPKQMLVRGALAFIGHVDAAWGYSFLPREGMLTGEGITPLEAFQRALQRILAGAPLAHALRDQHDRGVHLSSTLLETIAALQRGADVSATALAQMWIERNDARAYVLIGDPATRLRVDILGEKGTSSVHATTHVPPTDTVPAAPAKAAARTYAEVESPSFLPPHVTNRDKAIDHELLLAWKEHIKNGLSQNSRMFDRVLGAFMIPYWVTVVCYVLLFAFGLVGFGVAAVLAVQQQLAFATVFGGISVTTFLTFFISRPLRSLEQNILFITWLGVIYNTYWTQLMNAVDPETIGRDLEAITAATTRDLSLLSAQQLHVSGHARSAGEGGHD
jgi:hypothetical protein